jgi:hypothetical protein
MPRSGKRFDAAYTRPRVPRLRHTAARLASRSVFSLELPLIALWLGLASILALITAQVRDWNAMTDELGYERLAISIGQLHTLIPHTHGGFVRSLAQLYPLLISPWFLHGYVPEDLRNAHIFNAFLMSSACIPAFLLARRVTGRRWPAYVLAVLTVCTPWIIYSTVLLTENAGYPAFLWATLAMHKAITEPSRRNDVLALLGLALAFFARTQFFLLTGVLPIALVLYRATSPRRGLPRDRALATVREAVRGHVVLASVYAVFLPAAIGYIASGGKLFFLSVYGGQASPNIIPRGTAGAITGHLADLAFGMGILPFVIGGAWLLANALRSSATEEVRAFACVGLVTVGVLVSAISAWDLKIGHFVLDRYLYYLVPLLLLATLCALLDRRRPRWSLVVPAALVALGFTFHLQEDFLWSGRFPLSTDSPIATLYKPIADLAGGKSGASAVLVVATIALAVLFRLADRRLRHEQLAAGLATLLLVAFPLDTGYTFAKLFSTPGHSYRPLTQSQSGILDWLDRAVGTNARVTEIPYPVSTSFLVSQQFWRDLEFWNKSVRYGIHYPDDGTYRDAVIWFPPNPLKIDPVTGTASPSRTRFAVQSVSETRFRISGNVQVQRSDVMLIDADQPWRVDWLTFGLYDDGWTQPGVPARIRVFAAPGQTGPVERTLSIQVDVPPNVDQASLRLVSNLASVNGETTSTTAAAEQIAVCVPAHGFAEVRLTTPARSPIPGDQRNHDTSTLPREGGLLIANLSLADELGGACTPK